MQLCVIVEHASLADPGMENSHLHTTWLYGCSVAPMNFAAAIRKSVLLWANLSDHRSGEEAKHPDISFGEFVKS